MDLPGNTWRYFGVRRGSYTTYTLTFAGYPSLCSLCGMNRHDRQAQENPPWILERCQTQASFSADVPPRGLPSVNLMVGFGEV